MKSPKTQRKQTSPESLKLAKQLYLEGLSQSKIAERVGMKLSTLKYHISNRWKDEKSAMQSELISAMAANKRADLVEITSYGLTFLKNTLKKMVDEAKESDTPSSALLKTISTIVFEINKIKALDEGRPTEIMADITPSSTQDVIELLKKDPFLQLEDSYEAVYTTNSDNADNDFTSSDNQSHGEE